MKLSILIPTIEERLDKLMVLHDSLVKQAGKRLGKDVEIIVNSDNRQKKIGEKRNELIAEAKGDYIVFIDDDDRVPDYYIDEILTAIKTNPDCIGIKGVLVWTAKNNKAEIFEHRLGNPYTSIAQPGNIQCYYRYPNHLNPIKRELVKDIKFKEINFQEDYQWATEIKEMDILKTTVNIEKEMYYYLYNSNKK